MASIPPGDPSRDVIHPHDPDEPGPSRDGRGAGLTIALTILAGLIVVLLIVLL